MTGLLATAPQNLLPRDQMNRRPEHFLDIPLVVRCWDRIDAKASREGWAINRLNALRLPRRRHSERPEPIAAGPVRDPMTIEKKKARRRLLAA